MLETMKDRRQAKDWQHYHNALAPKVGDMAPDFELRDVNGENPIRLSDFRNRKPVALIFGNYT
ncbi:MAG: redoxin domain-containing protein [Deltaproteobacteria bacterium]|nr:redoxin domain-containing protein [Deltaproteobacteria bacterium]